ACDAFSRASKARPIVAVNSGFSSRSDSALPSRSSVLSLRRSRRLLATLAESDMVLVSPDSSLSRSASTRGFARAWVKDTVQRWPSACTCSCSSSSPGSSGRPTAATCCARARTESRSGCSCSRRWGPGDALARSRARVLSPAQALTIRAGWAEGEQIAGGQWRFARELALSRRRGLARRRWPGGPAQTAALRSAERLAALLAARAAPLQCEELVLRARLDLD